jgi:hypothetical protein
MVSSQSIDKCLIIARALAQVLLLSIFSVVSI